MIICWIIMRESNMEKVIDWKGYFMSLAHLSAMRSKDPNTKVGAVIVDDKNNKSDEVCTCFD